MAAAGGVILDPLEDLQIPAAQARSVTEVHFSGRNLTSIHPNFQKFVNLETLCLANNKLTKIDNLVPADYGDCQGGIADRTHGLGCLRLRALYLSNNRISTLVGDLKHLTFLQVLLLANNKLSNMEVTSEFLRPLQFLAQLDLFGNPLAEELNYREFFIVNHPSVLIFDRKTVTAPERESAARIFGEAGLPARRGPPIAFGKGVPPEVANYKCPKAPALSESVQRLEKQVQQIHAREAAAVRRAQEEEVEIVRRREEQRTKLVAPVADNDAVIEDAINRRRKEEQKAKQLAERHQLNKLLLPPSDQVAIRNSFGQAKDVQYADALAILKLLGQDDPAVRRELKGLLGESKAVSVSAFLELLLDWPLFVQARLDLLYANAKQALNQGRDREAQQLHTDINLVSGHLNRLKGEGISAARPASLA